MFARRSSAIIGFVALMIAAAGLADAVSHGRLVFVSPLLLGALALSGLLLLCWGLLRARGRARLSETNAAGLRSLAQELEATLATVSAVNARLHESEARYKGLVDSQEDAILRRGPDSRLTYGNDAFFKLFGLTAADAIGRAFVPEVHPGTPYFGHFTGRETGSARVKYDQHVRTSCGWRWIAWEECAIRDASGRLIEVQSVGRDITERKALESALTEARDRAEAASRAKSGFLATMSHEIRTPMNGVLGMARLLLETPLAADQRTYARAIAQSGESLLALIEDILDFSKIESGTMRLEYDDVELPALVESVAELLGPRAHGKGIELLAVISADAPRTIRADGMRLRQVLTNLVGNAVKFTEKGGVCIDVTLERRGRRCLRFEVRDTGVGVPADRRSDIFDEFVQADSSHARRFGGTGLGLAICKRLVAAMGGEIGVEAAPGGGSVFWFVVPVLIVRSAEPAAVRELQGRRVALVTHNAVLRDGLAAQLHMAGCEVVPNWSASAGEPVDALIVDAGRGPEPDLPADPDERIRSVVLIVPEARGSLARLRQVGFDAYLVKPVRQQSLLEHLFPSAQAPAGLARTCEGDFSLIEANSPRGDASRRRLRILLAEDNPVNALLTREILRRRGHDVTDVPSGDAALEALAHAQFDLVITDIRMPGLDGIETAQRIRAREAELGSLRTPIVALTADALETGQRACEDAGMDGFLAKPVAPAELDAMLQRLFPINARDVAA